MEQGQHSDEEESELSRIIGSPQTSLRQSQSPVYETSPSIEYDSLYQSGGLEGTVHVCVFGGCPWSSAYYHMS